MRLANLLLVTSVAACGAPGDEAIGPGPGGKADGTSSLREQLYAMVKDHVALSYADARTEMFNSIDVHDGFVESVYTGATVAPDGSKSPGGFNTEHVWPQSQGAEEEPPRSDLHHLFPVDAEANTMRASRPFGELECNDAVPNVEQTTCAWQAGGSALEILQDPVAPFEVRPMRRGDVARAKFYFSVRYELPISDDEEALLRQWHADDPPDARERARDEAIFAIQNNHNPFVVKPSLVDELDDF
jgi:deoxyribonuclease I